MTAIEPSEIIHIVRMFEIDAGEIVNYRGNQENSKIFIGDNTPELYLYSSYDDLLVIVRIILKNQRQGMGTKIINTIVEYAKEKGFRGVKIENASTEAMHNLAIKLEFKEIEGSRTKYTPKIASYEYLF